MGLIIQPALSHGEVALAEPISRFLALAQCFWLEQVRAIGRFSAAISRQWLCQAEKSIAYNGWRVKSGGCNGFDVLTKVTL